MDNVPEGQFDVMTPKTYVFGAVMILLGGLGIVMMMTAPKTYPLLTLFFYNIASSAVIVIFPHEPVIIKFGEFVSLWPLSLVSAAGTLVAMYLDYKFFVPMLNLSYSEKYKTMHGYQKASDWFYKQPFLILIAAAFLPVPFYPFKFIALSSKYSMSKFLAAVTIGRIPRYYLLGLLGKSLQIPSWVLISLFFIMLAAIYYKKIWGWMKWPFAMAWRLAIKIRKRSQ
jgi:membrane protein YqaA with SNARE-associated domain